MKYLVRFKKETNEYVDIQSVTEEYNHKYCDAEELPFKEGYYVVYEYNKEQDKVVGRYEELPKTETQILKEEVDKLKRAIAENTKTENIDLGELEGLNSIKQPDLDLSELDII